MAKKAQQNKVTNSIRGLEVEQTTVMDDSLLPTPLELEQYKGVDESLIPWLMEQTKKEQEHRHSMDNAHITLVDKSLLNERIVIFLVFLIIVGFIVASVFLLVNGVNLQGSIFAIAGLVAAIFAYKEWNSIKE